MGFKKKKIRMSLDWNNGTKKNTFAYIKKK